MNIKLTPFFRNLIWTFVTEGFVTIAFLIIYRLIAQKIGSDGVGEYSLIKRIVGFMLPLLLVGLGIGIPRYISMARDKQQRSSYVKVSGIIILTFSLVFLIVINLFSSFFAKIFFGIATYNYLVAPFSLYLAGLILYMFVYSYYRGRLFVNRFNILKIINLALLPLLFLVFIKGVTIKLVISLVGITNFIVALLFLLFFIKEFFVKTETLLIKKALKELLVYSFPRYVASILFAALLSVAPIIAAHFTTITEVGYLSVSQSLLSIVGVAAVPLGLILLPKISNMIVEKRHDEIQENLNYFMGAIIQLTLFVFFQFMIFADTIIYLWLGEEFIEAAVVMRIVFCSLIFYLFNAALASIVEASKVKPVNLINYGVSLLLFFIISALLLFFVKELQPIISLSIAFTASMVCMGLLVYFSVRKIYSSKKGGDIHYLWTAIAINILLGGIALLLKKFIVTRFYFLIVFEMICGFLYLFLLWALKMEWIRKIPSKIFIEKNQVEPE